MSDPSTALERAGAVVDGVSLRFTRRPKWEELEEAAGFIGGVGRAYPWWVGDLLNEAEDEFGDDYAQLDEFLPHSPQTLANYKSVAKHVPPSRRRKGLSYSVHAEVAYLQPRERDEMLNEAVRNGWKREEMRGAMQHRRELAAVAESNSQPVVLDPPPPPLCPHCGQEMP